MGTGPPVVLSVVEVSERVASLMVATSERLWPIVEDSAQEVALSTVDPASMEIVTAPKISAWLIVSTEWAEVSSKGFMLTVTKVPLEGVASVAAISPVRLLAACGVSADSVVLSVGKASEGVVVLVRCGFALVKSGKADVSGVDGVFPPVGL